METPHNLPRRTLFQQAAVGALALGLGATSAPGAGRRRRPGIALQLYSVREDCKKDFDRALERVAAMGFEAVEFAGYHKYAQDPKGLRRRLDDLGLKVAATHIGTNTITGDALEATVEFHQIIGCKYLCIPGDRRFTDPEGSKELADIFNLAAARLKKYEMYCGYHNHTHEFEKSPEGVTYWDLFARRTLRDVVLQQDVGWSTYAGQDPAALIRRYPGRSQVIHCKPTVVKGATGKAILGQDSVPWRPIFQACQEVGGTEWYTLEQERYPDGKSPMQCVALSLAGLKQLLG